MAKHFITGQKLGFLAQSPKNHWIKLTHIDEKKNDNTMSVSGRSTVYNVYH